MRIAALVVLGVLLPCLLVADEKVEAEGKPDPTVHIVGQITKIEAVDNKHGSQLTNTLEVTVLVKDVEKGKVEENKILIRETQIGRLFRAVPQGLYWRGCIRGDVCRLTLKPDGKQPGVYSCTEMTCLQKSILHNARSDRSSKKDLEPVSAGPLLERIDELKLYYWTYKDDEQGARHIGPMAQDFHSTFQLGGSDGYIFPTDLGAVALVAVQQLNRDIQELRAENQRLRQAYQELKDARSSSENQKLMCE